MVEITVETIGEERFIRGFNRIGQEIKDFREPFQEISEDFYRREKSVFAREGDPVGFKPLSKAYAKWKSQRYPGKKIMQLVGRLIKSLTAADQAEAQDSIKRIKKTWAEFGTQVPYAHRHQMGTVGMPKRMIVQLTEKDKVRWGRIIHEWAMKVIKRNIG